MAKSSTRLETAAYFAAVGAVIVSFCAFFDTAHTNRKTTYAQTEALAVELFTDYVKLAIDHPKLADRPDTMRVGGTYEWMATHAYVSAETIYKLKHGEVEWDSTVASMIRYHHALVRDAHFSCADYDSGFVIFVRQQLKKEFRCGQSED